MESYNRFLEFVRRSSAFSPALAMETATVLQVVFLLHGYVVILIELMMLY